MSVLFGVMMECLAMTVALEFIAAIVLFRTFRSRMGVASVILVNVLTNPVVVSLTWVVQAAGFWLWPCVIALELSAVAAEGFWYGRVFPDMGKPFLVSLLLNAWSFGMGFVLQRWF